MTCIKLKPLFILLNFHSFNLITFETLGGFNSLSTMQALTFPKSPKKSSRLTHETHEQYQEPYFDQHSNNDL